MMKTRSWSFFVLILLFLLAELFPQINARVFYNIGHMANELSQVEKYLAEGANALEINVQFSPQGRPERARHGFPCCFFNCFASEIFTYMLKYLRDLTTPEHPTYTDRLSLILLDLRVRSLSSELLYTAGERLTELLLVHLFDGGLSGSNVWVLLSVPSTQHVILFQGVRDTFRKYQMSGLLDKIGYNIGDNSDLVSIERSFDQFGITDHIWVSDGSARCFGSIRSRTRLMQLIEERDTGQAHFDGVYRWTIDDPLTMRNSIKMGVDAIITNRPDHILEILNEDEFYGRFRLATADDRPWEKVIDDETFPVLAPSEMFNDSPESSINNDAEPSSSSLVLADSESDNKKTTDENCKTPSESSPSDDSPTLDSISDELNLLKDADTDGLLATTTLKSTSDNDDSALSTLLSEVESSGDIAAHLKRSILGKSFEDSENKPSDILSLLTILAKNKENQLNSELLQVFLKAREVQQTPSISPSVLQALLTLQPTPAPSIPINLFQALLAPPVDKTQNLLHLLTGTQQTGTPSLSPEVARAILDMYMPTTTPPGVPLHVVRTLIGALQPPTPSINLDVLKLLTPWSSSSSLPSSSGISLDTLLTLTGNKGLSPDIANLLSSARDSTVKDKTDDTEKSTVTDKPEISLTSTKDKQKPMLNGKEVESDDKPSKLDSIDDILDSESTVTEKPATDLKSVVKNSSNRTRNLPFFPEGGPPIPPHTGATVIANFRPDGVDWKVIDRPGRFLPNRPPPLPLFPFNSGPPLAPLPPIPPPYPARPIVVNHKPSAPSYSSSTSVKLHPTIHLSRPIPFSIPSPSRPIRLPDKINLHLPISIPKYKQTNYPMTYNKYPPSSGYYPSTTPCPEPDNHYGISNNGHFSSNFNQFSNGHLPSVPSAFTDSNHQPLIPQRPVLPIQEDPFETPVFFDEFLKTKNNFSQDIPKDLFSSVGGVKTVNKTSVTSIVQEDEVSNFGINDDDLGETVTKASNEEKEVETEATLLQSSDQSVSDILDELNFQPDTKSTSAPTSDPVQELLTAFERIQNDKTAVATFLKKVNLTQATDSFTLTQAAETFSESELPDRMSAGKRPTLPDLLNLPPTDGLGWDGHKLDQSKLEELLPNHATTPLEVIVIENAPLILLPQMPTTIKPEINSLHSAISKRETTPPPDDFEYDDIFDMTTKPTTFKQPNIVNGGKPNGNFKPQESITISKPSEGLTKLSNNGQLKGELEIIIPGELFTVRPSDKSTTESVVKETSVSKDNDNNNAEVAKEEEKVNDEKQFDIVNGRDDNVSINSPPNKVFHVNNSQLNSSTLLLNFNKLNQSEATRVARIQNFSIHGINHQQSTRKQDQLTYINRNSNRQLQFKQHNENRQIQHTPPSRQHDSPLRQHNIPSRQHNPPTRQHNPPSRQHNPPSRQLTPPSRQLTPPSRQHNPPSRQHNPPTRQHNPPSRQHNPPTRQHSTHSIALRRPNSTSVPNNISLYTKSSLQSNPNINVRHKGSSGNNRLRLTTPHPTMYRAVTAQTHRVREVLESKNAQKSHQKMTSSQLLEVNRRVNQRVTPKATPQISIQRRNAENLSWIEHSIIKADRSFQRLNSTFLPNIYAAKSVVQKESHRFSV